MNDKMGNPIALEKLLTFEYNSHQTSDVCRRSGQTQRVLYWASHADQDNYGKFPLMKSLFF